MKGATPPENPTKSGVVNQEVARGPKTEFKFVICSESDFFWAENFAHENQLFDQTEVLYSPAHQRVDAKWLAEKILSRKSPARLQTQLHKFIWSAHVRGV
jgi:7-carboxy-7-deazaguanine synthase